MESHRVITALIAFMLLFSLAAGQPSRIRAEVGMEADVMSRQYVTTLPDGPGSDSLLIAGMDSLLNTINLDEVVVVAPIKPVTVKGDTTIIDTRAFKTRDGAYLEDLVRLIPGMAYDKKTGSLTYNGIPLTDININGESFFKDGKTLALENLRADIFSKIKIYDNGSQRQRKELCPRLADIFRVQRDIDDLGHTCRRKSGQEKSRAYGSFVQAQG